MSTSPQICSNLLLLFCCWLLLSHPLCRLQRHSSRAARPGIPTSGHTQGSFRIEAPPQRSHRIGETSLVVVRFVFCSLFANIPLFLLQHTTVSVASAADIPKVTDGWLLGNFEYQGFYRVMYDKAMWSRLAGQLQRDHTVGV